MTRKENVGRKRKEKDEKVGKNKKISKKVKDRKWERKEKKRKEKKMKGGIRRRFEWCLPDHISTAVE